MSATTQRMLLGALALALALAPGTASALGEVCTVSTSPIVFGTYVPTASGATDSTSTISVTCTGIISISVNYTIKLGTGLGGSYAPRRMSGGAGTLNYNLYTNAARSVVWGDGSSGTATVSDGYSLGLLLITRNYSVYGRIAALQNVAPGVYSDAVLVTVDY